MLKVIDIAKYICNEYHTRFNATIDEMKLHKLLYFAQRESLIQTDQLLFLEQFKACKFGPVMPSIRSLYESISIGQNELSEQAISEIQKGSSIINAIFEQYAQEKSWSLSRISHNEISWEKARKGLPDNENGNTYINNDDIKLDAARIKERRSILSQIKRAQSAE